MGSINLSLWDMFILGFLFCYLVIVLWLKTNIKCDPAFGSNTLAILSALHLKLSIRNLTRCRKIVDEIPDLKRNYLRAGLFRKIIVYVPFRKELYIQLTAGDYLLKLDDDFCVVSAGYVLR
ncbi:hypothetical protein WOSG25_050490 [Weissella oryzae SG25]|uniref:Uncharacterized protein n=1 Tax=Weissella oryzae (strain DSM 25784 / JCM 18191 / LMG 30913 / SG25) TaxID=1329250 RepID=A0A069CTT6_WEIOS|nr:hypothetical protein [Weissella oryzae]GAK30777.1 hypothetical protein WOSG25_050490 [Weissella oryzae SG25]